MNKEDTIPLTVACLVIIWCLSDKIDAQKKEIAKLTSGFAIISEQIDGVADKLDSSCRR